MGRYDAILRVLDWNTVRQQGRKLKMSSIGKFKTRYPTLLAWWAYVFRAVLRFFQVLLLLLLPYGLWSFWREGNLSLVNFIAATAYIGLAIAIVELGRFFTGWMMKNIFGPS